MATAEWLPFTPGSTVRFLPPVGARSLAEPAAFYEHDLRKLNARKKILCDPEYLGPCCVMSIQLWSEKLAPKLPVSPAAAMHVFGGFR